MSHHYSTDEGRSLRCNWCNKIVIPPHGLRGYFTDGDIFNEYHFCSNACYHPFKNNSPLEECDDNGKVHRQVVEQPEYLSPNKNDDFDVEAFERLPAKKNKPVSKSPSRPTQPVEKKLNKKDIKQNRKNTVNDLYEFLKNKK